MYSSARYLPSGDKGIVIEFGNAISSEINKKVRAMFLAVESSPIPGLISFVPTYRSLLIEYDPLKISYAEVKKELIVIENTLSDFKLPPPNVFEVPVFYGEEMGPDMAYVCTHSGLAEEEVIKIHADKLYLIYMLGFTPGFSYLGGMDERLESPRLDVPRQKIEKGSVGIAGMQTGIYSVDSPGGWRLIGKTPIEIYNSLRNPPIIQKSGDYIKFMPISIKEYEAIEEAVKKGNYEYRYYPLEEK